MDEATASVDPENEQELQKAIRELTKDKTIPDDCPPSVHQSTADQIIVLRNGRIVQRGNHKELMREDGLYPGTLGNAASNRLDAKRWKHVIRRLV